MKKAAHILFMLFVMTMIMTSAVFAQNDIYVLPDSTTTYGVAFGRGLPRYTLVMDGATGRIYRLGASYASTFSISTSANKKKINVIQSELDNAEFDASAITTGTFDDDRIAESNVTQHEAALSIGWDQLTSVDIQYADISPLNDSISPLFTNVREYLPFMKEIGVTDTSLVLTTASLSATYGDVLHINTTDTCTIYLGDTSTFNILAGKVVSVFRKGTGDVQIRPSGTATIIGTSDANGRFYIDKRYQFVAFYREEGTNNFIVYGALKQ